MNAAMVKRMLVATGIPVPAVSGIVDRLAANPVQTFVEYLLDVETHPERHMNMQSGMVYGLTLAAASDHPDFKTLLERVETEFELRRILKPLKNG